MRNRSRTQQVADLLSQGLTQVQIAQMLGYGERTIRTEAANIRKGITSKANVRCGCSVFDSSCSHRAELGFSYTGGRWISSDTRKAYLNQPRVRMLRRITAMQRYYRLANRRDEEKLNELAKAQNR